MHLFGKDKLSQQPVRKQQKYVLSVYDKVANIYGEPYVTDSLDNARRMFVSHSKDPKNILLHEHGSDFELRHIGFFCPDDLSEGGFFEKPVIVSALDKSTTVQ